MKQDLREAVRRELARMPEEPFDEFARDKDEFARDKDQIPGDKAKVIPIREPKRLPDPPLVPGVEF